MESPDPKGSWWAGWHPTSEEEPPAARVLDVKLERLHRELRYYRIAFAVMALLIAGLGFATLHKAEAPALDVVKAHRVEVLSPDGRPVVVLDADRVGGRLALRFNQDGEPPPPALFLTAEPGGGAVQLFEPGQNFYALSLGLGKSGEGIVKVRTRGMREGVILSGPKSDKSGGELQVFNAQGRPALRLATDDAGHAVVARNGQ